MKQPGKHTSQKRILSDEERKRAVEAIQEYFQAEREEEIGFVAADKLLDFFIDNISKLIGRKLLAAYRNRAIAKLDDAEIEALQLLE